MTSLVCRLSPLALALVVGCGGGGDGDGGTGTTPVATSVTISPATVDSMFSQNATVDLDATVRDQQNAVMPAATVAWSTSNPSVAAVNATTGVVTAGAVGNTAQSANITATVTGAAGVTASVPVRVRQKLASIDMPTTGTVAVGATVTLAAVPRDANNNTIPGLAGFTYGSANTSVATVNATTGVVSGVAAGTAKIGGSLTGDGATRTDTTVVTVTGGSGGGATVTTVGLTFSPSAVTIARDQQVTWTLASNHNVTFSTAGSPANIPTCASGPCETSRTFPTAGTFNYLCSVHGASMSGSVTVNP